MKLQIFACTLAAQIRKSDPTVTLSDAMKTAWSMVKTHCTEVKILVFVKTSGTECRRVVSEQWSNYYTPKGTGRQTSPGLRLFADMAKVATNQNPIISAYETNIISLN